MTDQPLPRAPECLHGLRTRHSSELKECTLCGALLDANNQPITGAK